MPSRLPQLALTALIVTAPLALPAQAPVGELFSTVARVRGAVTLAGGGTTVLSGSSIEAGEQPAQLQLNRGGTLVVCQGTTVTVSASQSRGDLMFSFGSGTIESAYKIGSSSDVIITPDFRFVITGPGDFDFDVGILPHGDTCVRSRGQSTGGIIVNEQFGDGSYQVKPSESVVFRKGRVANVEVNPAGVTCGCPPVAVPARETQVAKAAAPTPAPAPQPQPIVAPAQGSNPNDHVVADAPFVFTADATPPPITARVMHLRVESGTFSFLQPQVQQPPAKPEKKGFWHKLKSLFS